MPHLPYAATQGVLYLNLVTIIERLPGAGTAAQEQNDRRLL